MTRDGRVHLDVTALVKRRAVGGREERELVDALQVVSAPALVTAHLGSRDRADRLTVHVDDDGGCHGRG